MQRERYNTIGGYTKREKKREVETNCLAVEERHFVRRFQILSARRLGSVRIKIKTLERRKILSSNIGYRILIY